MWYWNWFKCGEHTGTHFDAPIHWISGKDFKGNSTDTIPVERFIGPACVIDVADAVKKPRSSDHGRPDRDLVKNPRPHPRRRLGADPLRLVEAHQPR